MTTYFEAYSPIFGSILIWWIKILTNLFVFDRLSSTVIADMSLGLLGFDLWAISNLARGQSIRADRNENPPGIFWYVVLSLIHHIFGFAIWHNAVAAQSTWLIVLGIALLGASFGFPLKAMGPLRRA